MRDDNPRDGLFTASGLPIRPVYTSNDWHAEAPELPGAYPYTRGIHTDMYVSRPWTIRQYAGFASAEESNARYRLLLERGQSGLSVAFDLPTQIGYDSDAPEAEGEVGRVGVAIDTLDDMETLFSQIPLDKVSTSMTINATAPLLLLLYELAAERQGVPAVQLSGTIQNDILKEYIARGTYIFPPRPSMRLIRDTFRYCHDTLPRWNPISISGYHIREAGSTAVQELAFTFANAVAYVEEAARAGLSIDAIGPRLSFFFNAQRDFFEEIAKYRAARRLWAQMTRQRFGATDPRAMMLRFHTQTAGSSLTAQQPYNNVVRIALQAMSAVLGGTQSLHTCAYDEALALPTEAAATLALRTQQILASEVGLMAPVDPLGGSYYVEALTDDMVARAAELLAEVDARGGAVAAIESGWVQEQIDESAYRTQQRLETGEESLVGVNIQVDRGGGSDVPVFSVDQAAQARQIERLRAVRARRSAAAVTSALDSVRRAAQVDDPILPALRSALATYASIGEVCAVLRAEWGTHR